jgi:small subunit ribosomal protein S7e
LEDEVAKSLYQLELNNANLKDYLALIFINSAELVEYEQQDGSRSKCLVVKIPHRSLASYKKVTEKVISHLEQKFNWPVVIVATRTIISKRSKLSSLYACLNVIYQIGRKAGAQKRPRSRTLTAVHEAILEDIVLYIIIDILININ